MNPGFRCAQPGLRAPALSHFGAANFHILAPQLPSNRPKRRAVSAPTGSCKGEFGGWLSWHWCKESSALSRAAIGRSCITCAALDRNGWSVTGTLRLRAVNADRQFSPRIGGQLGIQERRVDQVLRGRGSGTPEPD